MHTYTATHGTRGHRPPTPTVINRVPLSCGEGYGFYRLGVWGYANRGRTFFVRVPFCICYMWYGFCGVWIGPSSPIYAVLVSCVWVYHLVWLLVLAFRPCVRRMIFCVQLIWGIWRLVWLRRVALGCRLFGLCRMLVLWR